MAQTTVRAIHALVLCVAVPALACVTDGDCSLNGICKQGSGGCQCDKGWKGASCAKLDVLPVPPSTRGKIWPPTNRTSSWGANLVWRGGRWHMAVSEMSGHCGLASWQHNSFIRHASASSMHGPFDTHEAVLPVFSHNAMPTQMPDGTLVVWHVGLGTPRLPYISDCVDGTTPKPTGPTPPPTPHYLPSWFPLPFTRNASEGNWSWDFVNITVVDPTSPTFKIGNLASYTYQNGTTLLSYTMRPFQMKANETLRHGFGLAVADSWRGPFRARYGSWGRPAVEIKNSEDSFLWRDMRGNFHLIFHHFNNKGGHAYSTDGWKWEVSMDHSSGQPVQAYSSTVVDSEGGNHTYYLRQRPALVMGPNGAPVALITAVADAPIMAYGRDRTSTLLQALAV